ncbi:Cyclic nucleotide-gated ion channel 1 [Platanthera guangdongensis]|uniref:Cyclic nucleotide-gated ion channel 1 n=1 Tax=Platanthera guangdongensis TaxID=2320717 RepID=A0ABR2M446_9ASPA
MNQRDERFVWFQDFSSHRRDFTGRIFLNEKEKRFSWIGKFMQRLFQFIHEAAISIFYNKSMKDWNLEEPESRKIVLDPQGPFLQRWNKIFVLSCVVAVSVDPLFFYIPVVDGNNNCLDLDKKLEITASVLRSFTDIFYVLHIIFQFRTGFIAPSSRVFGRGVLVEDSSAIARRYLSSSFLIDILAVLPLPQESSGRAAAARRGSSAWQLEKKRCSCRRSEKKQRQSRRLEKG